MTGTGTQNDPYIVETFVDFLDAVGQSDVYVELGSDIDVAADGYEYIGAIAINALSVDGRGYAIRNATFQMSGGNCFYTNSSVSMSNISLLDCSFKMSDNANIFGSHFNVFGMKISIQVQSSTTFRLFSGANAENVAADVTIFGGAVFNISEYGNVKKATFFIRGNYKYNHLFKGANASNQVAVENVGAIFDGTIIYSGKFYLGCYTNFVNCYFAVNDGVNTNNGTIEISINQYAGSASNVVFSVGALESGVIIPPSGYQELTTAQIKDEAYLQSIGWLP